MQIDWFTFGAQIVNFLILVALLKRFLFGPIVEAMDKREAAINTRLEEAGQKKAEAEKQAQAYTAMQEQLEAERGAKMEAAEAAAHERRQALLKQAREEVDHLEAEWRAALERNQHAVLDDFAELAVQESIALARKALADLADANVEAQTLRIMQERLRHLSDDDRAALADAFAAHDGPITVRSVFPLSSAQQEQLRDALEPVLNATPSLTPETDTSLGFGIEIRVRNRVVAWTLQAYLDDVLDRAQKRLNAETRTPEEATA